ncbi:MAG TPA: 5'-3' exonuclease H3TH domain-containing protein [Myxococcota bacterium]|nr:5'-3' exonuclease H3TH domain-containing protein [Myxococcota bacterium]
MSGVKVHLLDATYELFRHFYAVPPRAAPDGQEVGAVHGVLRSVLGLLGEPGVTHLGAATDHVIESFRNELFAGYKTGDGVDPLLMAQFPVLEEALAAAGVLVWAMVELEADDALATAAAALAGDPRVAQVVICSPDKDLTQCVRGDGPAARVVTLDRRTGAVLDAAGVRAKFGVPPASIPDYLGLVGDDADGIPGIPGWGAKSAAAVLARYGTLDAIPDDPRQWDVKVRGADRLADALSERRDEARLWRRLATLRADAPIPCTLEDLAWRGAPRSPFAELCARLGFADLRDRPGRLVD